MPVLWRAYEETDDPVYRDRVVSHGDRHWDWYIREDGRAGRHAEFDPETVEFRRQYNELAYSDETCWAHGQRWCIAGLARTYEETGADRYLDALRNTVDYYVANSPDDLVPNWTSNTRTDPTLDGYRRGWAHGNGLTRLSRLSETTALVDIAEAILNSLVDDYMTPRSPDDDRPHGMILVAITTAPPDSAMRTNLSGPITR